MLNEILEELNEIDLVELKDFSKRLANGISEKGKVIIVYDCENEVPASSMYWACNMILSDINVQLTSYLDYLYYIAPYLEEANVIAFIDNERILNRLRETSNLLGHRLTVITSVKKREESAEFDSLHISYGTIFKNTFSRSVLSIMSIIYKASAKTKFKGRVERLGNEVEGIYEVVEDMLRYYRDDLYSIVSTPPDIVLTSTILKPHVKYAYSIDTPIVVFSEVRELPVNSHIHVFKTSLEDREYGELVKISMVRACKLYPIDLRTDPITAQLYALIILEAFKRIIELL